MDARAYRALDTNAYEERRNLIVELATNLPEDATDEQMREIDAEVEIIRSEDTRREGIEQLRTARAANVSGGSGLVIDKTSQRGIHEVDRTEEALGSEEYERAFAAYMTRDAEIPHEFAQYAQRQNQVTTTTDTGVAVPTTLSNRVVEEMREHSLLFPHVSHDNVSGGVDYPVINFKPTAKWITETGVSDTQKAAAESVSFKYYTLEVRTARSALQHYTTLAAFNNRYVAIAAEAMGDALDLSIANGTGSGQPLGITKDPRVKVKAAMKAADVTKWDAWHKNFKAKIKPAYSNGVLIMNNATFEQYVNGMVDANGNPICHTTYGVNGQEIKRFLGKIVIPVGDEILKDFDTAGNNEVFGIYANLKDYMINSNLQMRADNWEDKDNNQFKTRHMLIADGKPLDTSGMILITKSVG